MSTIFQFRALGQIALFSLASKLLLLSQAGPAQAWIFSEHEEISRKGVQSLSAANKLALRQLWSAAKEEGDLLCQRADAHRSVNEAHGNSADDKDKERCIDFSALPALAGDHSCTSEELRETVSTRWVEGILRVADQSKEDLRLAESDSEIIAIRDRSHIDMQKVHVDYLLRASGTRAHFPLPRSSNRFDDYLPLVLDEKSEANALGYYALFHVVALKFAALSSEETKSEAKRLDFRRRALWNEAFALHFLEDSYSAGHIVGNWGGNAWAKGTHDYYSQHGIEATNWDRKGHRAFGDAFIKPMDIKQSAQSVQHSLAQLLAVARGDSELIETLKHLPLQQVERYEKSRACGSETMPHGKLPPSLLAALSSILKQTPRPSLGPAEVHHPRFRMELGPYVGVNAGIQGGMAYGGYHSPLPASPRGYAGMLAATRFGMGLEGVTSRSLDGQFFAQVGVQVDSLQVDGACIGECPEDIRHNSFLPRVPGRSGMSFRVRMPFYLVPADVLVVAPLLMLVAPKAASSFALTAANGGLIPLQRIMVTSAGDFQFILGREVGLTIFDWPGERSIYLVSGGNDSAPTVVSFRTFQVDLPLLEYRPVRSFQSSLTSSLLFQFGSSVDFSDEDLGQAFSFYLRFLFDTRFYVKASVKGE